ncbi:hypothetical protein NSK_003633 [Nannochloropsis salina CCMP1776]|uniref:Conserved oligomeric Golgi complex subunit 4 n=1 Tax=Nannochloropsis salina CCMP1776 TaxID=1027361 RepID=A0A4D9D1B9_9STRA|nr:hypothetical protein NSK_003633 [Nannochloropsis salina CCMP1776]|eukprot:TFJ85210.1 hypothetical protein NSK_003633 [Nannochloropsis salina CCMP1776]
MYPVCPTTTSSPVLTRCAVSAPHSAHSVPMAADRDDHSLVKSEGRATAALPIGDPASEAAAAGTGPCNEEFRELLESLRNELDEVTKKEASVEAALGDELDSLLIVEATKAVPAPDGKQLALQMKDFEKVFAPTRVADLTAKVSALTEHVYGCQELAEKMSSSVRELDERQMRVQRVLAMVEDIINLKTCAEGVARALEEDDLLDATSYVRQFHSIEGASAKASGHYNVLVAAEARLKETVLRRVHLAVSRSELDDVFKFCPLLGPLGLAKEGASIYESFAERLLKEGLDPLVAETSKLPAVQLLPKIYNTAAGFLQRHLPLVSHGFKQVDADVSLIRLVQRECEDAAIPVIRRFLEDKGVAEKCRAVAEASRGDDGLDGGAFHARKEGGHRRRGAQASGGEGEEALPIGEMDGLMDALALVIQHTESYDRFLRHVAAEVLETGRDLGAPVLPVVTDLNGAVAEVAGPFALLEDYVMRASVAKALQIDELPALAPLSLVQAGTSLVASGAGIASIGEGDDLLLSTGRGDSPLTSSAVDDSFYVLRRCARRALVTGHAGTASAIINYINGALSDELMSVLSAKVRSLRELPLPIGLLPAASSLGAPGAGAAVVAVKQHWSKVKEGIGAGLETAQQLTAAAGSLMGGAAGVGLGGGGLGAVTCYPYEEAKNALDRLVMLNNLSACARYTLKLQQELMAEVPSIFQDDPPTQQLMACLQDMSVTAKHFEQTVDEGLQHVAALIKPKLRSFLQDAFGVTQAVGKGQGGDAGQGGARGGSKVSYELDEDEFAANEAADPFTNRFLEFLGGLLGPISLRLTGRNFSVLKMSVVAYIAKRLEYLLMRLPFTQLGALQLDKDLRCLIAFFPSSTGYGEYSETGQESGRVRDYFARLMQMSHLLNLDVPTDVVDVFGGNSMKLTVEEALNVMRLRTDWEEAEICKAQEHLLMTLSNGITSDAL